MIMSHEMGRIFQMADDCTESIPEALPTYISILVVKYSGSVPIESYLQWVSEYFFQTFQSNPFEALDYENYQNSDLVYYAFGHSIFDMYLDERWGGGTGEIIADISLASRQEGSVVISQGVATLASGENEPDLYDAVDTVLQPKGGNFWDAVKEFALWRLFTGELADSEHFQNAAYLPGVAFDSQLQMFELPLSGRGPANPPAETGTSYFNVTVDPSLVASDEDTLLFEISSVESAHWHLMAVTFNRDGNNTVIENAIDTGQGYVTAAGLSSATNVVFAATNLGDLTHDPDDREWDGNNFTYGINFYHKPSIGTILPQQVTQGEKSVAVVISGSGLQEGVQVDFGEGIMVTATTAALSGDRLDVTIDVAPDSPLGWHALRVFYRHGPEARLEQGIEVLSGQEPEVAVVNPGSGFPGESMNVEIMGQRFLPGVSVSFGGGGITVERTDFIDSGVVIAKISIDRAATPGPRSVTATNPDTKSGTLEDGFVVEALSEANGDEGESGVKGDGGCGCSILASKSHPPFGGAAFYFLALFCSAIFHWRGRSERSQRRIFSTAALWLVVSLIFCRPGTASGENAPMTPTEEKVEKIYRLLSTKDYGKSPSPQAALGCHTMNRLEAFRLWNELPLERKKDLDPLFAPPAPLGCLESAIYPIRSCYNTEAEISKAEAVLNYAETSWRILIDEVGFWPPKKGEFNAPEVGMDFYLGDTYSYGAEAYTSPTAYDETVEHNSCLSYIVINEQMEPMDYYVTIVGHELDHACQMSMD